MRNIILIAAVFSLSSCGATGSLVGGIVSIPVKVVRGAGNAVMNYDEHSDHVNVSDIHQAAPLSTQ